MPYGMNDIQLELLTQTCHYATLISLSSLEKHKLSVFVVSRERKLKVNESPEAFTLNVVADHFFTGRFVHRSSCHKSINFMIMPAPTWKFSCVPGTHR